MPPLPDSTHGLTESATSGNPTDHTRTGAAADAQRVRVLLVDDEAKLRRTLAEGLRLEDWDVIEDETAAGALQHIRAEEIDLLVLDWMLPDGDGLQVVQAVRAEGRQMPIILMTARDGRRDKAIALEYGATDFLSKPFSFDDLLTRCRAFVATMRARTGHR